MAETPSAISAQPYSSIDALHRPPAELLNMRTEDLQAQARFARVAIGRAGEDVNPAKVTGGEPTARVAESIASGRVEPGVVLDPRTGQPIVRPTDATAEPEQPRAELPPGDDLYSDLLRRADELLGPPQPAKPPTGEDQPAESDSTRPETVREAIRPAPDGDDEDEPIAVLPPIDRSMLLNLKVTHDSFASKRPSPANVAIRQAEALMRAGRFFSALGQLAEAEQFDPDNPLVWLRACHAHVGAGQFQVAADALAEVMAVFPSALSVKTDLSALMGGPKGIARRLGELAGLARRTGSLPFSALLCYLQFTSGQSQQAQASAHRLRAMNEAGPKSPGVAALVNLVLEGEQAPEPAGGD
jgi:hypothetical protein